MATLITRENVADWLLWPQTAQAASIDLLSGATVIATVTAVEGGTWANAAVEVVAHNGGVQWDLQCTCFGIVNTYVGFDTSAGNDNTATIVATVENPRLSVVKVNDGRPDEITVSLAGGLNERAGLSLAVLVRETNKLIASPLSFWQRNPEVEPLVRGWLAAHEETAWADLDQTQRDAFIDDLLAAIDD